MRRNKNRSLLSRLRYLNFVHHWIESNAPETENLINKAFNELYDRKILNRSKHSNAVNIGDKYEKHIAESYYTFNDEGWTVEYFGINKRLEDLGRDLIATRENETVIIQCKCWAQPAIIHERHIFQLYGTLSLYKLEHPSENVSGTFFASTTLSEEAKHAANVLGIKVYENVKLNDE
jgi:hypothetical protein